MQVKGHAVHDIAMYTRLFVFGVRWVRTSQKLEFNVYTNVMQFIGLKITLNAIHDKAMYTRLYIWGQVSRGQRLKFKV